MFPLVKTSDTVATVVYPVATGSYFIVAKYPVLETFMKALPAATFSLRCVEVLSVLLFNN